MSVFRFLCDADVGSHPLHTTWVHVTRTSAVQRDRWNTRRVCEYSSLAYRLPFAPIQESQPIPESQPTCGLSRRKICFPSPPLVTLHSVAVSPNQFSCAHSIHCTTSITAAWEDNTVTPSGFFPDRLSVCFVYHWYNAARGCSIRCKYVSPPSQVEKTKEIRTMNNIYNNSSNVTYNRVGYCSLYFLLPTSICIIKISTPEYLLSVVMFERWSMRDAWWVSHPELISYTAVHTTCVPHIYVRRWCRIDSV